MPYPDNYSAQTAPDGAPTVSERLAAAAADSLRQQAEIFDRVLRAEGRRMAQRVIERMEMLDLAPIAQTLASAKAEGFTIEDALAQTLANAVSDDFYERPDPEDAWRDAGEL